jgi:hypothetical protein
MEFMSTILMSVVVALLISMTTFAGKVQKGEAFDWVKLVRTLLIGVVLGVVAGFSGFQITAENWEMYATANAGAVAIVDQLFKAGLRVVMPKANIMYDLSIAVVLICMTVGYAIGWVNHVGKAEPAPECHAPHAQLDPAEIPEL